MATQFYKETKFAKASLALIGQMNEIVRDYVQQGYRLTVRQLYYQLVAGAIIPNTEKSYKRVTGLVNDAKLGGLMDWNAIEDRTREFATRSRWNSRSEILRTVAETFHMDQWANQPQRPFVIVEKEALAGVLDRVCREYDVPLLAARGYPSGTVLREFCKYVMLPTMKNGQEIKIFHFGDHDPSGLDMTRDLTERIAMFCQYKEGWELKRVALNMDQIEEYNPPPNPAKTTDARFQDYQAEFGDESWELDALTPSVLTALVVKEIDEIIEPIEWEEKKAEIEKNKERLSELADQEDDNDE